MSKILKVSIVSLIFISACTSHTESTIFYLVRHAEKDLTDTTDNPALTKEGYERAEKLKNELKEIQINGIFSTSFQRNINTVKPLAESKNLSISTYEWTVWQPMLDTLSTKKGESFVICGHGDNLLPMITYLGAQKPFEELGKHDYDNIFKVILSEKKSEVEVMKY